MEKLIWHTEKRALKELISFENNPRILNKKNKIDLQNSLKKFGLVEIPVIDLDNVVLAGNQRLNSLLENNNIDYEIDVRVPNRKLTEEEKIEYNIRSNKNVADWDFKILENNYNIKSLEDWGFEKLDFNVINKNIIKIDIKTEELKPFNKTHILLSFNPNKYFEILPFLNKILEIEGIEHESSSN